MATTAKRGRPAKKTVEAAAPAQAAPKKEIFKAFEPSGPTHHEYELTSPNGLYFMMKAGPVSVYDESTDSVRSIRYIPREDTIFTEEQTSKPVKQPIMFENGRLWVRKNQPNLKRFLDMHPGNEANGGNIFRKVNLEKSAQKDLSQEFEAMDAIMLLREKPLGDILAVATAFAVNTDRPVDEIKHDLMQFAKRNPKTFIEAFDNPVVEAKAKIRKAMDMGIINHSKGHVKWTDTNKHIIAVPVGQDAVDVFTRFCMTETGSVVLSEIERQL